MQIGISIVMDVSQVDTVFSAIDNALGLEGGPFREALNQSADVYMDVMVERFVAASGGDGTWEPLAESTIRRKTSLARRGGLMPGISPEEILVETGELFDSLHKGNAGHIEVELPNGVRRGTSDRKGVFNNPTRPILGEPDNTTLAAMAEIQTAGLRLVIAEAVAG